MKLLSTAAIIIPLFTIISTAMTEAFQCRECHSKNPRMVAMHQAVEGRNCFDCHKIGERLMGRPQPKNHDSLLKRRVADPACIECHRR